MRGGALQHAPSSDFKFRDAVVHVLLNSNYVIRELNYISASLGYPGVLPSFATLLSRELCRGPGTIDFVNNTSAEVCYLVVHSSYMYSLTPRLYSTGAFYLTFFNRTKIAPTPPILS